MARNVFISFRFSDGHKYKEELAKLFNASDDTVDFSENVNRTQMSESTIKKYLYDKLRRSSVTIVLLTPEAINHQKDWFGHYDDWMYDEIRYSLEDRENNRTNGLIAVYVPEVENIIIQKSIHICERCLCESTVNNVKSFDNLVRKNMMNVKKPYKKNKCEDIYDSNYDSYCSLIPYDDFKMNLGEYIDIAAFKREHKERYDISYRL